jgi:hypothetical protein
MARGTTDEQTNNAITKIIQYKNERLYKRKD